MSFGLASLNFSKGVSSLPICEASSTRKSTQASQAQHLTPPMEISWGEHDPAVKFKIDSLKAEITKLEYKCAEESRRLETERQIRREFESELESFAWIVRVLLRELEGTNIECSWYGSCQDLSFITLEARLEHQNADHRSNFDIPAIMRRIQTRVFDINRSEVYGQPQRIYPNPQNGSSQISEATTERTTPLQTYPETNLTDQVEATRVPNQDRPLQNHMQISAPARSHEAQLPSSSHARVEVLDPTYSPNPASPKIGEKGKTPEFTMRIANPTPGRKKHQCPTCQKVFTRSTTLRDHMRSHTSEKPFKCSICDKGFARSKDRTRHESTHGDEKIFICKGNLPFAIDGEAGFGCGSTFARADGLKVHFRGDAGLKCMLPMMDRYLSYFSAISGLRTYSCSRFIGSYFAKDEEILGCEKVFGTSWDLRCHLLSVQCSCLGESLVDAAMFEARCLRRKLGREKERREDDLRDESRMRSQQRDQPELEQVPEIRRGLEDQATVLPRSRDPPTLSPTPSSIPVSSLTTPTIRELPSLNTTASSGSNTEMENVLEDPAAWLARTTNPEFEAPYITTTSKEKSQSALTARYPLLLHRFISPFHTSFQVETREDLEGAAGDTLEFMVSGGALNPRDFNYRFFFGVAKTNWQSTEPTKWPRRFMITVPTFTSTKEPYRNVVLTMEVLTKRQVFFEKIALGFFEYKSFE